MSRLVVVSNRTTSPKNKAEAGGLAVALQEALTARGGIWFGWSGKMSDSTQTRTHRYGQVEYVTVDLKQKDYQDFYVGLCNSVIWPLFHYRIGLTEYTREMYDGYQRVNSYFAEKLQPILRRDDAVWVHDYQLISLGAHLRGMGVNNRIGFFLHIPFPTPEVLTVFAEHREMIRQLCAYDIVGFQTEGDLKAFLRYITENARGVVTKSLDRHVYEVHAFGRKFRAGHFAISIDAESLMRESEQAVKTPQAMKLEQSLNGRSMIIGVDRLDYSKGLVRRVKAFHSLLQTHPGYLNQVSYVQITPPSRTDVQQYQNLRQELEAEAAHINGINSEIDWVPIRYMNKSFPRRALAGFYRKARVGLVTPLRDGMNLVAKEYAACQNPDDPGVLVLSEFAGAARELDSALIVNPFDVQSVGDSLHKALSMPLEERQERHAAMIDVLLRRDIGHWTESFLKELAPRPKEAIILPASPYRYVPPDLPERRALA